MKFDFALGNPPYNSDLELSGDNDTYMAPVYDKFIDASYLVADKVELIHPARFLFNAGATPKPWNKKMLKDEHLKVLYYERDSRKIFPNTDIKGGIVVTYHDKEKEFGAIEIFTHYPEVNSLLEKIRNNDSFQGLDTISTTSYAYHFTKILYDDHPELINRMSKGHQFDLKSNVFEKMPEIFEDVAGEDTIRIVGRFNNKRVYKYINRKYINSVNNLDSYKLFMPRGSGRGDFGESFASTLVGIPGDGHTETFLSIGNYKTSEEAKNTAIYIKTKFARALLSVMKVTQIVTPGVWKYVPLQDFTTNSDIDWSKTIPEIDQQLYKKYGLSEEEIEFIETHVKEMN